MNRTLKWLLLWVTFAIISIPAFAGDPVNGSTVYAQNCASCHGANPLASLNSQTNTILAGANNPTDIKTALRDSPFMTMVSVTADQVYDVAAYLGSLLYPTAAIFPDSGYWWNTAEGGRGYTIERNPTTGNVFFATYLYSANGNPIWYAAGPAPMNGNTFSAPLAAYTGGQTLTGAYKPASLAPSPGNVSITFSNSGAGTMILAGTTIAIQRYEFITQGLGNPPSVVQPQTGYWWNPAEGGRGYTVEVQNNNIFIAAYMYDGLGNPVWYASGPGTSLGKDANTNTYVFQGTWMSYSGGQTLTGNYQSPGTPTSAGSLTLQFTTSTSAVLTLPDGRQIPIQRYSF